MLNEQRHLNISDDFTFLVVIKVAIWRFVSTKRSSSSLSSYVKVFMGWELCSVHGRKKRFAQRLFDGKMLFFLWKLFEANHLVIFLFKLWCEMWAWNCWKHVRNFTRDGVQIDQWIRIVVFVINKNFVRFRAQNSTWPVSNAIGLFSFGFQDVWDVFGTRCNYSR